VRESRDVSRKRRMTVLRQLTAPAAVDQPEIREADEVTHPADIHPFAADCRAQLPLRVSVTDERSGQSEELLVDRPFALVGSSETSDVRLLHPDGSRNHAYLQVIDGRVLCCDLASRSAYTPFASMTLPATVTATLLRGTVTARDGKSPA